MIFFVIKKLLFMQPFMGLGLKLGVFFFFFCIIGLSYWIFSFSVKVRFLAQCRLNFSRFLVFLVLFLIFYLFLSVFHFKLKKAFVSVDDMFLLFRGAQVEVCAIFATEEEISRRFFKENGLECGKMRGEC